MREEAPEAIHPKSHVLPGMSAALVFLLGGTVLLGWLVGWNGLNRLFPGLPAMVPATAASLLLAAGILESFRRAPGGRTPRRFATVLLLGVNALELASHTQLVPWPEAGLWSLQSSPQTAVTLLLLGGGLLCANAQGRANAWGPGFVLGAFIPCLIALAGYVFQEPRLYGTQGPLGMAPHTLGALLLLAVGALALQPHRAPVRLLTSPAAGGVMARRMMPALLLPLVSGALFGWAAQAGLIDFRLAPPLFIVTMVVALAAIIWRNALTLNRLHEEQVRAEQQARADAERQRLLASDNERLYEAAQQAAAGREEVLAIVSHDLKNPLSTIRLSTTMMTARMAQHPELKRLDRQVGAINRAVAQMLTLIHQLLDAARLDGGQALAIERHPEPVDALVEEALALIESQALRKSLRLEKRLATGLTVPCDRDRIQQVLTNLLGNAVKFTPEGGTLTLETRPQGDTVLVTVRDTGPGIPREAQPHLFERHWQAEKTARQGSGLGLYIARGIIQAHGGRLWVESAPGQGSAFTFCLPTRLPQEDSGEA
ncbi:Signal transduction histidine kinase [Stigmatella aurantiaca]|uniref:histidine kinase n=1 Tax=Stigmatella aurantiaca TaxID=41 RepID=A0A1H7Z277_STIAU|nr:HAMP domain-containing sensor histidine kinase [Stigmatella aurantiaca]SEM52570.1 Signal transduction histidine kinase [Stigmatella aurantiaca]